jgi:hypothetical protein
MHIPYYDMCKCPWSQFGYQNFKNWYTNNIFSHIKNMAPKQSTSMNIHQQFKPYIHLMVLYNNSFRWGGGSSIILVTWRSFALIQILVVVCSQWPMLIVVFLFSCFLNYSWCCSLLSSCLSVFLGLFNMLVIIVFLDLWFPSSHILLIILYLCVLFALVPMVPIVIFLFSCFSNYSPWCLLLSLAFMFS